MLEEDDDERGLARWAPLAGGILALVIVCVLLYFGWRVLSAGGPPPKPAVQQISIVQPPPPPPPPPPEEEPPPPEEQPLEEEPPPDPEPQDAESDEPPPGEDLGLDAEGTAGADGFGLVGKKGGRSLLGGAGGFRAYGGLLKTDVQRLLENIDAVRGSRYSVVVRLWIAPDGFIDRSELVTSSGDPEVDAALRAALGGRARLSQAPPADLPQPVKLRITSRT